jgi:hypothetical protein
VVPISGNMDGLSGNNERKEHVVGCTEIEANVGM